MSVRNLRDKILISGLVVAAVAAASIMAFDITGLRSSTTQATETPVAAPAIPVSVATVETRQITRWNQFSGRLEAVDQVELRSRVAGAIQSVHFREGALVKTGDLLFTIDPAPYAAEVARARAAVNAAEAKALLAASELLRGKRLIASNAVSRSEYEERVNSQASADAELAAAKAVLQVAELNLGYTEIRAPIDGRVGRIEITAGNLIAAGPSSPVLTRIVSLNPIYASFEAGEDVVAGMLSDLPEGLNARSFIDRIPVEMDVTGHTGVKGKLQLVDNAVDPSSGTIRVRAVFDNAGGALIPGQFARLNMGEAKATSAILIHERAVGTDQNKKFVMVVKPDNTTEYREISLGGKSDGLRIVTAGLSPRERIVVNGLQRIRPGALIAPQDVAMTAGDNPFLQASIAPATK